MKDRKLDDPFVAELLAIDMEDSQRAGTVGFISRALTQATLPHRPIAGGEFTRRNGNFTLSIMSPSIIGPVSYTHLDVYKRQFLDCVRLFYCCGFDN